MNSDRHERVFRNRIFHSFDEANYYYRSQSVDGIVKELNDVQGKDECREVELYKRLYDILEEELCVEERSKLFENCLMPLKDLLESKKAKGKLAKILGDCCLQQEKLADAYEYYRESLKFGEESILADQAILDRYPGLMYDWLNLIVDFSSPNDCPERVTQFVNAHVRNLLVHEFDLDGQLHRNVSGEDSRLIDDVVGELRDNVPPDRTARITKRSKTLALCQWFAVDPDATLAIHQALLLKASHQDRSLPFLLYANRFARDPGKVVLLKWLRVLLNNPPNWDAWASTVDRDRILGMVFDAWRQ